MLATDLDTRFLDFPASSNVTALHHDVTADPCPGEPFDLIHARFVLCHLPGRQQVLQRLAGWLKPGGWLLVEDPFLASELGGDRLAGKFYAGVVRLFSERLGSDYRWALTLPETRHGDFDDPDGLVAAFGGAQRLLLVSTGEVRADGYRVVQHGNAIRAAVRAGVRYIVYTSLTGADRPDHPVGAPMADHAATEVALAESGLAYTVLRNNMYSDLLLYPARAAVASGVLASNRGGGATGYVTRDDCAATAAALLVHGGYSERLLDVTGPAAVTDDQVAAMLGEVTGRRVRHQTLTDEQVVAGAIGHSRPPRGPRRPPTRCRRETSGR